MADEGKPDKVTPPELPRTNEQSAPIVRPVVTSAPEAPATKEAPIVPITIAPQKTADRPHRWTIGLSLLAATISIVSASFSWLSLNETRENRRLNEQTARAYLKPTSLVLDASLFTADNWPSKTLKGSLTITNAGRLAAVDVNALLDTNPPRKETLFDVASFEQLPPGSTNTVRIIMKMSRSKSMTDISDTKEYVFGLTMRYLDGVTKESRSEDWTFCMSNEKAVSKGMVSLYPCDVHFGGFDSPKSGGNTP
jgi:hypothetical protein